MSGWVVIGFIGLVMFLALRFLRLTHRIATGQRVSQFRQWLEWGEYAGLALAGLGFYFATRANGQ